MSSGTRSFTPSPGSSRCEGTSQWKRPPDGGLFYVRADLAASREHTPSPGPCHPGTPCVVGVRVAFILSNTPYPFVLQAVTPNPSRNESKSVGKSEHRRHTRRSRRVDFVGDPRCKSFYAKSLGKHRWPRHGFCPNWHAICSKALCGRCIGPD